MHKEINFSEKPYLLEYQNLIYKGPYFHRDVLELFLVMRGEARITIEGEVSVLKEGDYICINSGFTHEVEGSENLYMSSIYFDLKYFEEKYPFIFGAVFYCKYISGVSNDEEQYLALRNYIIRTMLMESVDIPNSVELCTELCEIMMDILINHLHDEIYLQNKMANLKQADKERMFSITKFINANYNVRGVSLSDLAEHEHLSETRLSHYWKSMTTLSFIETISQTRFMEAKRLLMENQLPISKIVEICGYSDEKYLYKRTKEWYGMTPSEFRKNHLKIHEKPDDYTVFDPASAKNEITQYSFEYYRKLNDMSFLVGRPDMKEEINLNDLYSKITTVYKKKLEGMEIPVDTTVLTLGVDFGLRYVNGRYEINWEYLYSMGEMSTKLFEGTSVIVNIELMDSEQWFELFAKINYVFYDVWGKDIETPFRLFVAYKGYENIRRAEAFAAEACRRGYFSIANPVLFM